MQRHRIAPAPGTAEHRAQRAVLLELVVDPPAAGDRLTDLPVRLGHPPETIASALDDLIALGLAERDGRVVRATPAALRFEALDLIRG